MIARRGFLGLCVALSLAACGPPAGGTDPISTVRPLYAPYLADAAPPPALPARAPLSGELRGMFAALDEAVAAGSAQGLDFDPVIDGQDYQLSGLEVTLEEGPAAGRAMVKAAFRNFGADVEVFFDLIEEGGAWVIDDVHTAQWTLRALLAQEGITASN